MKITPPRLSTIIFLIPIAMMISWLAAGLYLGDLDARKWIGLGFGWGIILQALLNTSDKERKRESGKHGLR